MTVHGVFSCDDMSRTDRIFGPIAELHLAHGYASLLIGGDVQLSIGKRYKITIEELLPEEEASAK